MSKAQHYITVFSRFFVGVVFVFSGLIKLNDPVGTAIKMEEYFEVFAVDFGSFFRVFIPWSLEIGFAIILLEIALGVAMLLCYRTSITVWALLALVVFFGFLTFYSAYFNKVTDCGCFGDAIKLTPWQSFYKDLILMVFVLPLFRYRHSLKAVGSDVLGHSVMASVLALSLMLGVYALRHLPFIDFRAYRVGASIPEQMEPEEQPLIEYLFTKDGKEVVSETFLSEKDGYTYVSSRVKNEDKIIPAISDYRVLDQDGQDKTSYTFEGARLLVVAYDVAKASSHNMDALRALLQQLDGRVDSFILTASPAGQAEAFRHAYQLALPYYFADATVLKTIVRSNPGLTLWKDGNVLGKWHYNDMPTAEQVFALL